MAKAKKISAVSSFTRKTKSGKTVRVKAHVRGMGKAQRKTKSVKYETYKGHFIQGAKYHPGRKEFTVSIGGKTHKYFDVPKSVADGFGSTESKGSYFAKVLKKYRYKKIN